MQRHRRGSQGGFQSTRPLRGATCSAFSISVCPWISIHAPLAGRDPFPYSLTVKCGHFNPRAPCGARRRRGVRSARFARNFNPRAPCGARPQRTARAVSTAQFQSTRPLRGATQTVRGAGQWNAISIHAPLAGRDRAEKSAARGNRDFNPRAPCGARLRPMPIPSAAMTNFNPRAPCGARPIFARQKRR